MEGRELNRRAFFKQSMGSLLPILGVITFGGLFSHEVMASELPKSDCNGNCTGLCTTTCYGDCKGSCSDSCAGACKTSCSTTCGSGCGQGCSSSCTESCLSLIHI